MTAAAIRARTLQADAHKPLRGNPTLIGTTQTNGGTSASQIYTPPSNCMMFVSVHFFTANGTGAGDITLSGGGLTWTRVFLNNGGVGNNYNVALFYATVGTSPGSITVTATVNQSTGSNGIVMGSAYVSGAASVRQSATAFGTSIVFGSAPLASSVILSSITAGLGSDPAQTPPSGYTSLFNDVNASPYTWGSFAYGVQTSTNVAWGGSASVGVAIEVT